MKKIIMKKLLYIPYLTIICTICLINGCDMMQEVDKLTSEAESFLGERNTYVAPPAPEVTVASPTRMDVTDYVTFTGTTKASESVNLAARVTGNLESVGYTEGDVVKQDTLLFTIEPAVYEAKVDAAKASLAAKHAALSQAKTEYERAYRLYRANAGSDTDLVKWREAKASAEADVDMAKAELTQAEINLGYTKVRAPFDGRVGLWKVDAGNLVGPDSGVTSLGTIIRYAPMYAYFTISERDVNRLTVLREARGGEGAERGPNAYKSLPVELSTNANISTGASGVTNASGATGARSQNTFNRYGVLDYGDLGIDSGTGTYLLRGVFPNDDAYLLPGMFVRVRFVAEVLKDALVIPMKAVSEDQAGQYVLVVNADNVAERRGVVLGPVVPQAEKPSSSLSLSSSSPSTNSPMPEQFVVVRQGLSATDKIITVGLMRARAGSKVAYK